MRTSTIHPLFLRCVFVIREKMAQFHHGSPIGHSYGVASFCVVVVVASLVCPFENTVFRVDFKYIFLKWGAENFESFRGSLGRVQLLIGRSRLLRAE